MQLKAAYILGFGGVRRTAEKLREVLDPLHIVVLGLLRELADRHVFNHAPTQRAYCLFGHGDTPGLREGLQSPSSQNRTPNRAIPINIPLPAVSYRGERVSPLTHCGRIVFSY